MEQERFNKVKEILQRETSAETLSTFEFNLLDNFLGEVRRELVNDQPDVILKLSKDEAQKIRHCLGRTMARNTSGDMENILDVCEKVEEEIIKQLNIK